MESQLYAGGVEAWIMPWGRPLRIERRAGEFRVLHGRVWLTRRGDPDDHVLQAGQCVALRARASKAPAAPRAKRATPPSAKAAASRGKASTRRT